MCTHYHLLALQDALTVVDVSVVHPAASTYVNAAARAEGSAAAVLTFRHPKLFKDVYFPFLLIVFQPLLGAVLLHSLCCNTHYHLVVDMSLPS